ncbi:MAG: PaaI family thioesterase [Verrucomicrobia bacterium]|nr:PaaI family thioesterase [Verrucomicrobiota bacterium]
MKDGWLPWTKSCFVCGEQNPHGLRLRSRLEGGRVVIDYTTRRADAGYRQVVHGGIAATLLDEVMTWAAIVAMKKVCVAAELTTRLKAPIGVGQKVGVEGWVTRAGSRLCLTEGVVRDAEGRELLSATGKYMPMPAGMASLSEKDFVHSPEALDPLELVGRGG